MNINRYNYEEFFILYLDNELDAEDRREVENFAGQHPDLKEELDILMQSKLTPDEHITFTDKDSLMRFGESSISLANYEEWLTAYIDNELTGPEKDDADKFIAGNPSIQRELNLLQRAKLQPETIVFPYKDSLYRKEERPRVIAVRWWRIAAAAVLLLAMATTGIVLMNNNKGKNSNSGGGVASTGVKQAKKSNDNPVKPTESNSIVKEQPTPTDKKDSEIIVKTKSNSTATHPNDVEPKKNNAQSANEPNEESLIAKVDEPDKTINATQTGNGKIEATDPGNVTNVTPDIAKHDPPTPNIGDNTGAPVVTTSPTDTYNKGNASQEENPDAQLASQKGGGLRGFFRKVTRTIEKRANIKASDDNDRLLIAGLSIKMN